MSKLAELAQLGQSIWYDFIRRSILTSGELRSLIDQGVRGVTSNPAIFEKAIAGNTDYDQDMKHILEANPDISANDIYEKLAFTDITLAADLLRPVYDDTSGADGYVSLEVDPTLAHDTQGTIAEARRLFETIGRPNVMIKVPATRAGVPAIADLIGAGVNVNVTLIFSLTHYRAIAEAYLTGLETLDAKGPTVVGGHGLDRVASVASFFVSRTDSTLDTQLAELGRQDLMGTIAVSYAKAAYAEFNRIFGDERWQKLAAKGAHVQRLLWASTGTKNPVYSDTLYVDTLIGPDTVNTLPPATLTAFLDHGTVAETVMSDMDTAMTRLEEVAGLGIDMETVTQTLQDDGVEAFARPFEKLMRSIVEKRNRILA